MQQEVFGNLIDVDMYKEDDFLDVKEFEEELNEAGITIPRAVAFGTWSYLESDEF